MQICDQNQICEHHGVTSFKIKENNLPYESTKKGNKINDNNNLKLDQ